MPAFSPEKLLPVLYRFAATGRCWVAYSGGLDSEVLLHSLVHVRDRLSLELRTVHVDHGLHPDASRWAARCRQRCLELAVPLQVIRVDAVNARGESPEAAARTARYRAMAELLSPGDLLLTAHHRDDQAETLLLALMRGSGPKGLAAMPQAAPLGAGRLVRPLLVYARSDLRAFAQDAALDWIEDPGNRDSARDRNFLRHRVLPLLAERWPSCTDTMARSARHCAESQGLVDALAQREVEVLAGTRPGTLSVSGLRSLEPALARAVVRRWVSGLGLPLPDEARLARILREILAARPDAVPLVTWRGCEARRHRDDLFAMPPLPLRPPPGVMRWTSGSLQLPPGLGRLTLLDGCDRPVDPVRTEPDGLQVRFGEEGTACRPGRARPRKPLRKQFQEAGVPPWLRGYVPLVFAREQLAAVGDLWCCEGEGANPLNIRWEGGIRSHPGFVFPEKSPGGGPPPDSEVASPSRGC